MQFHDVGFYFAGCRISGLAARGFAFTIQAGHNFPEQFDGFILIAIPGDLGYGTHHRSQSKCPVS